MGDYVDKERIMSQAQETQPEPSQNSGRKTKPNELNLIWVDLEMTGLDPETDRIIEVALVVTDPDLNILAEGPFMPFISPMRFSMEWMRGTGERMEDPD